ncbi:MAG: LPP20 family lipoprotein [Bdellovibrionales bacterium]|nr:LPP20 family lipoprotein [Bdellovibrionales bacterium]
MLKVFTLVTAIVFSYVFLPPSAAAQSADERPSWVDGEWKAEFPEEKFLVAVGSGTSRNAAAQDAKKALAESFRAKVASETKSEAASEMKEGTDATQTGSASQSLRQDVKVTSAVELRGIRVAKHFHDTSRKEHFALAVIDRLKLKSSYSMELMKRKKEIQALHDAFRAAPTVAKGKRLLTQMRGFEELSQEATVVGAGMPVTEALQQEEMDAVEEKLEELREKNVVAFRFEGAENQGDFEEELSSCLSDQGVSLSKDTGEAKYRVSCKFTEKPRQIRVQDWVKYDFSASVAVARAKGRTDRKRFQMEASGRDRDQAFESAAPKLARQACDYLVETVSK